MLWFTTSGLCISFRCFSNIWKCLRINFAVMFVITVIIIIVRFEHFVLFQCKFSSALFCFISFNLFYRTLLFILYVQFLEHSYRSIRIIYDIALLFWFSESFFCLFGRCFNPLVVLAHWPLWYLVSLGFLAIWPFDLCFCGCNGRIRQRSIWILSI